MASSIIAAIIGTAQELVPETPPAGTPAKEVESNPGLPAEFPQLKNKEIFGSYAGIVAGVRSNILPEEIDLSNPAKETIVTVRNILRKAGG